MGAAVLERLNLTACRILDEFPIVFPSPLRFVVHISIAVRIKLKHFFFLNFYFTTLETSLILLIVYDHFFFLHNFLYRKCVKLASDWFTL